MFSFKKPSFLIIAICLVLIVATNVSCGIYSFKDVSIPPNIKTIRIEFIENRAPYINPRLAQELTERLRRKVVSQTRLTQTNADNADYNVKAVITGYDVTTSGVTDKQASQNRLTVTIEISLVNQLENLPEQKFTVSRPFDFPSTFNLQTVENSSDYAQLLKGLTDDMFNRLFSSW